MFRCQLPNKVLPDHGRADSMIGTSALLGNSVPKITGHRPQAPARQAGQQASGDFMGADNSERKVIRLKFLRVKVFKERFLKTGIMDDGRARIHLIGSGNAAGGLD